jgi:hypothetical protein
MFGSTYSSRLSWVMVGCGSFHGLDTCSPPSTINAAMIGVRH